MGQYEFGIPSSFCLLNMAIFRFFILLFFLSHPCIIKHAPKKNPWCFTILVIWHLLLCRKSLSTIENKNTLPLYFGWDCLVCIRPNESWTELRKCNNYHFLSVPSFAILYMKAMKRVCPVTLPFKLQTNMKYFIYFCWLKLWVW